MAYASNHGSPVAPVLQVLTFLHFCVSRSFGRVVAHSIGISISATCNIIKRVGRAVASLWKRYVKFPSNLEQEKQDFFSIAGFPGIIGAVDCTQIRIPCPNIDNGLIFINWKGYFSINCQVVCSASLKISSIVARRPGSTHVSRIFQESRLRNRLEQGRLRGALLGDGGYVARSYLFTPLRNPTTPSEHGYQHAHTRSHQVVERLFGMLK